MRQMSRRAFFVFYGCDEPAGKDDTSGVPRIPCVQFLERNELRQTTNCVPPLG
jgi:hypothetical protein